ncbi:MAG: hypothetical protein AAGK97_18820, partial [Bacteroidota bacterium]
MSMLLDGTIPVIAVSLTGGQFLIFTYSGDYEGLNTLARKYINIGFFLVALISSSLFTILKMR